MALTAQQLTYLRTASQRFRAYVGVFNKYEPTVTVPTPGAGTALTPLPIPRCAPRYQLADLSETVNLYGRDSFNRGGAYVGDANITFALDAGSSGSVTDNTDGTATYTAPAAGSGIAQINITVTNANGSKVGYAFVQYPKTTYDTVIAEVTSISGGLDQHGYKLTLRAKGDVSAFDLGKLIHLHVEDTWGGTTSTFGGYQHHETVFNGYITALQQFTDASGDAWLGCEVSSPWWLLSRTPVGETYWGLAASSGNFYIADFHPVDAIWHFVNNITDFSAYHDVVLWQDQNIIDNFIIDASDLGTITADVMARTLSITYCDRYGSLFCIPDPDVRSAEYWGTPSPQYTGSEVLSPDLTTDYTITYNPNQVKRLTLAAFDQSRQGIYAISENPTALGEIKSERGLLCDAGLTLVGWAVERRAQYNRPWQVDVGLPLNHTMDICNFADVNFTAPNQTNGKTASGRTWLRSLTYRPDFGKGAWVSRWQLVKQTQGDGESETGAASSFGGTGEYIDNLPRYSGDWSGAWSATGATAFCFFFDFVNSGSGNFTPDSGTGGEIDYYGYSGLWGEHVPGYGWSSLLPYSPVQHKTGNYAWVFRSFPKRVLTGIVFWASAEWTMPVGGVSITILKGATHADVTLKTLGNPSPTGEYSAAWSGVTTASAIAFNNRLADIGAGNGVGFNIRSAMIAGYGPNPFGPNNCP